jgi:outer membrane protein assembly factor BamB
MLNSALNIVQSSNSLLVVQNSIKFLSTRYSQPIVDFFLPIFSIDKSKITRIKSMIRVYSTLVTCLIGISNGYSFEHGHLLLQDTLNRSKISFAISDSVLLSSVLIKPSDTFYNNTYTKLKGITTFRGGPYRDRASIGRISKRPDSLVMKWSAKTAPQGEWGGGAGWTGQPSVVQWPNELRSKMNIDSKFNDSLFVEVISASLDGSVYFLDLETGGTSRKPIKINNPIKGSVSIDPRGLPILYIGQGIANKKEFGFRIFSLIDQRLLYFLNGRDSFSIRSWAAFDGAPLINAGNDVMYLGGENGLLYCVKLNTKFDSVTWQTEVAPQEWRLRYKVNDAHQVGIENSVAAYGDKIFFADNHGYILALSLSTLKPLWVIHNHDDTDASLVIQPEAGIPYLYTGSEVDKQGKKGFSYLKKINGLTGATVWEKKYPCLTVLGDHPVNGGMLSTPIMGKFKASGKVIFNLSRYKELNKGLLVALNQTTGEVLYEVSLSNYSWSSPVDIYDEEGNMYIFLADSKGYVMLLDGENGAMIYKKKIADLFEASPVVFDNKIVIPSRPNKIFCLEIR